MFQAVLTSGQTEVSQRTSAAGSAVVTLGDDGRVEYKVSVTTDGRVEYKVSVTTDGRVEYKVSVTTDGRVEYKVSITTDQRNFVVLTTFVVLWMNCISNCVWLEQKCSIITKRHRDNQESYL